MSLASSANDFIFTIVLFMLMLIVLPALFGLISLISRIFKLSSGAVLIGTVLVLLGVVCAISLYLDNSGSSVHGLVTEKSEAIALREEGDWKDRLILWVAYRQDGSQPGTLITADRSSAQLTLTPAQFDQLRKGDTVTLKVLPLWRSLALVRLSGVTTRDLIPLPWLAIGVAVLGLIWLFVRLIRIP